MYLCLAIHCLQFAFLRKFRDQDGKINRQNDWVWAVHLLVYPIIGYEYFLAILDGKALEARKVWVALDLMLTLGIGLFFLMHICAS